jgi:hypothetical protein
LLPSKIPQVWGLYSYQKFFFLIGVITIIPIGLKLLHPRFCKLTSTILEKVPLPSPNYSYLTVFSIVACFTFPQGAKVGEDICFQVKSTQQFVEGNVKLPNFCSTPKMFDLSKDDLQWQLRPPGASWLVLPFMLIGMSLGHSIIITLFVLGIVGGIGWILLAKKIGIGKNGQYLLSILLGTTLGFAINSFGTMNSVLHSVVPWMIIFSIHLVFVFRTVEKLVWFKIVVTLIFFLILGLFCLIKTSGMIVSLTIGMSPIIILLTSKLDKTKKYRSASILLIISPLTLLPYFLIEKINELETGTSSDNMYRKVDYSKQTALWGNHFTESTQGWKLGVSALGSPGYAMPPNIIAHNIRDCLVQFKQFKNWANISKINPHVLVSSLWGMGLFSLYAFVIIRNRSKLSTLSLKIIVCFITIPFFGLASVSYLHGFNYSLYASHTLEYSTVLLFPIILLWETIEKPKLYIKFLTGLCLALTLSSTPHKFASLSYPRADRCSTESDFGLSESRFSRAIESIEIDSINPLDVLFFLPAGDMGDLILRTKMRTLATHFSGGNFPKAGSFKTSKTLNVYCAYDSSLGNNKKFIESFDSKFPQKISKEIIHSEMITVLKITLSPSSSIEHPS